MYLKIVVTVFWKSGTSALGHSCNGRVIQCLDVVLLVCTVQINLEVKGKTPYSY